MTKALYITFNTTHNAMKANKLLKSNYETVIVPAPKELSKSGCSIAIKTGRINEEEEILQILNEYNLKILKIAVL